MKSIFTQKSEIPTITQLQEALGETYVYWQTFAEHTKKLYPNAIEEWSFASEKFGWSFRIKDKKRIIIYLLPRDKFFKVAFVFGQKATDTILESDIADAIKNELQAAKVYAEGRGIRIDIKEAKTTEDILKLIAIKIAH
ncbi:DUF3788 domain-containing protein [Flavobacterium sp. J49]|uniref:DUF3788 family protein n=1 Tax=Flavobacterium sp. J49 TaxID=2718534 RepID=UPI001594DF81|nr:DUF3788 family protein [Flavobacterium sp. J49]MBF6640974.1 DUF3788 domain-containing protein [Flavobacterium sp. J49]NIC02221.1 DUF3788 family protein [Flavobacterium sp. J49]